MTGEIDILNKEMSAPINQMPLTRSLSITIPKETMSIEELITRLRYLETPECRSKNSEVWRLEEIKETTKRFKKALQVKEFFSEVIKNESLLFSE